MTKAWQLCSVFLLLCGFHRCASSTSFLNELVERAAKEFSSFGFSVEPSSMVVARNETARLDCATHGGAKVKIEWRKESATIRPDTRRQILANGSLLITKVVDSRNSALLDQTDEGDYQCVALVDDVGTYVSRKANIKVASLSRFEAQPSDRTVSIGMTVVIPCVVDGTPQPVFTWYKDGNLVDLSIAGRLTLIPKIGSLEIQNVTGQDDGIYYCKAENSDKPRSSEAGKLTVVGSSPTSKLPKQPDFEAKPQSVVVVEGSSATLECSANGHPHPKIQWLKNQKFLDLTLNPRFKVVGQGSLVISNVQAGDEGQFTCRAMNSEDSSDSSATVVVHTPPSFVTLPQSIVAKETEDVHFECEAEGKPGPSVLWMKNGEILTPSDYFQIEGTRLKINGLVISDSGVFQCLAENTGGTAQASAQLLVERAGKNRSSGVASSAADLFGKDNPADSHSLPTVETPETSDRGGTDGNNRGPSEPIQIRSIFVSSQYVTIQWNPPTNPGGDIIAYSIYYKQEGSARERVVNSSAPNLEEVTIKLLLPSTVYYFRVVAYNKFGPGKSGGPLKVTTNSAKAVPGKVRSLKAEAVSPNSIIVSWEPPLEEGAAVQIYKLIYARVDDEADQSRSETPDETDQELFGNLDETEIQLATTSYDFHDLDKFATYSFRVEGHNRNGAGMSSDPVRVRTLSDVPSGPPLNVTAEPATSKSFVINWNPPAKDEQNGIVTGYKVRYKKKYTNDSSAQMHTFTTDGSSRSHIVADLSPASLYAVRVAAVTVNGTGPWSAWIHVSTYAKDLDESQVPGAPAQLQLQARGRTILIAWVPPADNSVMIRGYKIGWGLGGVPDLENVKLLGAKHKSHKLENLKPGRPYLVSVRAFNNVGEGYPSYETATTGDSEPSTSTAYLLPPVGLRADTLSSTAIQLKWVDQDLGITGSTGQSDGTRISDNRRYVVQYTAKYLNGKLSNQTVKETEVKIENLRPYTTYEFSVKVVKGKAESVWSMSAYNTTSEAAPGSPPQDISVMQIENSDSVVINWKAPKFANGAIIGYSIFWTDDTTKDERQWSITTLKDSRTSATLENLRNGAVYHFKIQAMTEKGWGPMSNATRYKTQKSQFPADAASAGTKSVAGNRLNSNEDSKVGGVPMNVIIVTIVVGVGIAVVVAAIIIGIYFCKRQGARKRAGYQAGVKKQATHKEVQNPPDLWIHHHENFDRRNSAKNGESHMGSVQDLRIREPSPPAANGGMELAEREVLLNNRPLSCVRSIDESMSPTGTIGRRVGWAMPMVQNSPQSQADFNEAMPNGTLSRTRIKTASNSDLQPSGARSVPQPLLPQYGSVVYTGPKHHQNDHHGKSPYGSGFVGPPPVAQPVPMPQVPSGTPALVHMGTNSSDVSSHSTGSNPSRLSNPLSSFASAPPPPSASISPNPQRHLPNGRNLNNNGELPSYPYATMSTSVPGQSHQRKPAGIVIGTKSPGLNLMSSAPRFTNDPYVSRRDLEIETLPHSHSTEELNAQMKSLDSLMKDLNDISQNEFDIL